MNDQDKPATDEQIDILMKILKDNNLLGQDDPEEFFKQVFKDMGTDLITEITSLYTENKINNLKKKL